MRRLENAGLGGRILVKRVGKRKKHKTDSSVTQLINQGMVTQDTATGLVGVKEKLHGKLGNF